MYKDQSVVNNTHDYFYPMNRLSFHLSLMFIVTIYRIDFCVQVNSGESEIRSILLPQRTIIQELKQNNVSNQGFYLNIRRTKVLIIVLLCIFFNIFFV